MTIWAEPGNAPAQPSVGKGLDMDWRSRAVCGGARAGLFFSPEGETPAERARREARAKAICSMCPVRGECRDFALSCHVRYGIWGGLTEDERFRERLHRGRRGQAARR